MIKDKLENYNNPPPPLVVPFSWEEVKEKEKEPSFLMWWLLLLVPWTDVYSSKEDNTICALTSLDGRGCYIYKRFGDHSYLVRPADSPGFPGS